jgi:indole-3-acetate monooxygenase
MAVHIGDDFHTAFDSPVSSPRIQPVPADLMARLAPVATALAGAPRSWQPADRLPASVHQAILATGLWKLWVPRCEGGLEHALPAALALFEQAASLDGSLGFALAIGTGGGLFAAYLPAATATEIFAPPEALIAGSGAPTGTATPTAGGYIVDGEWRYASLVHAATWITASVRILGEERVIAVAVPVAQVEILDTWDAQALAGTDSHDIRMRGVHVPAARVFDLSRPPRLDGALYRFDFMALAASAFAAVAVGIARGAVTTQRQRLAAAAAREGSATARLARATSLQRSAWRMLSGSVADAWRRLDRQVCLPAPVVRDLRLAAVEATRQSVAAVDQLAEIAGMQLLAADDPLSRAWRDVHGVAQHALVCVAREAELGAALLGEGA